MGVGLSVSGYLLARTFALSRGHPSDAIDICSTVFQAGCDDALLSSTSWQLGIPLAGWGVVYYGTLVWLLTLGCVLGNQFAREAALGAVLLAGIGACGSVLLAVLMMIGRSPFCPLCMIVHAVNLALVAALSDRTVPQRSQQLQAKSALPDGPANAPLGWRWKVVGFVTVGLIAMVVYQQILIEWERCLADKAGMFDVDRALADYVRTPKQEIPINADDPRLGAVDGPVRLVVFSDFQCPGCRSFARLLRRLAEKYGDNLAIAFKHYPLGKACNPNLTVDKHPGSCGMAWAAEAARRQDRFWVFYDVLFSSDLDAADAAIQQYAKEAGLDLARFEADWHSQAIKAKVNSDIELGRRLGVDATPAVFLNERRVRYMRREVLELLIEQQLEVD